MCRSLVWYRCVICVGIVGCMLLSPGCTRLEPMGDRSASARIARIKQHHPSGKMFTALIGPYDDGARSRRKRTPVLAVTSAQPGATATSPSTEPTLEDCSIEIINGWVLLSGWSPCARTRHVQAAGQHTTFIVEADSAGGFDRIYLLWDDIDSGPKDEVFVYDFNGTLLTSFKRTSDDTAGERYIKILHSDLSVHGPYPVDHGVATLNRRTFVNAIH